MDEDQLIDAVRCRVIDRELPPPATSADVAAFEAVVGLPMPRLLRRLYLEVADGGFGSWDVLSLTDTGHWFSDHADIAEAYRDFTAKEPPPPKGIVPLMDRGCCIWTLIDFRTSDGQIWDWDPSICCLDHALAPVGRSLAEWLDDWLTGRVSDGPHPARLAHPIHCPEAADGAL